MRRRYTVYRTDSATGRKEAVGCIEERRRTGRESRQNFLALLWEARVLFGEGADDGIVLLLSDPEKREQGERFGDEDGEPRERSADRGEGKQVERGTKGIPRNVRGEAVAILMAAMMIGGFLVWMIVGRHHGMGGGIREAGDSRPAAVASPKRASPGEVPMRGGSHAARSEEGWDEEGVATARGRR